MISAPRPLSDFVPYIAPPEAPHWCRALSMTEHRAREIIEPGNTYSIAPREWALSSRWVAAVRCNGPGQPFAVLSGQGWPGGIFPHWHAAAAFMVHLATEYEAAALDRRRGANVRALRTRSIRRGAKHDGMGRL